MNKKAKMGMGSIVLIAAVILVAGMFGLFKYFGVGTPATITPSGAPGQVIIPAGGVSCPSSGQTNVYTRLLDGFSTTTSYLGSSQPYLLPVSGKTDGLVTLATTASSTTGTASSATAVTCDKVTPGVYRPTVVNLRYQNGQSGVISVDYGKDIVVSGTSMYFASDPAEFKGAVFQTLQYRVHNEDADAYLNCTSGTSLVAFVNDTSTNTTRLSGDATTHNHCFEGTTGVVNRSITAAGQYWDLRFDVKANASNTQFGQDDLRVYVCTDYTTSTWNEPVVSVGGVQKSNVKTQMQEYDIKAIGSNWELCYDIGTVTGNTQKSIYYYHEASADVTDSIRIGFFAEGRYKSSRNPDKIQVGIYDDAATQVPVATTYNQEFMIMSS